MHPVDRFYKVLLDKVLDAIALRHLRTEIGKVLAAAYKLSATFEQGLEETIAIFNEQGNRVL